MVSLRDQPLGLPPRLSGGDGLIDSDSLGHVAGELDAS